MKERKRGEGGSAYEPFFPFFPSHPSQKRFSLLLPPRLPRPAFAYPDTPILATAPFCIFVQKTRGPFLPPSRGCPIRLSLCLVNTAALQSYPRRPLPSEDLLAMAGEKGNRDPLRRSIPRTSPDGPTSESEQESTKSKSVQVAKSGKKNPHSRIDGEEDPSQDPDFDLILRQQNPQDSISFLHPPPLHLQLKGTVGGGGICVS